MVQSYHIVLFYCSAAVLTGDLLISVGGYWGSGTSDFGNVAVNMRHFAFWSGNFTDFAPMIAHCGNSLYRRDKISLIVDYYIAVKHLGFFGLYLCWMLLHDLIV